MVQWLVLRFGSLHDPSSSPFHLPFDEWDNGYWKLKLTLASKKTYIKCITV